jgi:DNA primase catalytic core
MENAHFRDLIEAVRDRVDICAVIGRSVKLDRHGRGLCPFHQEKTPSFSVNRDGRYFHCFACGASGDVFRFIEVFEKKTFWQAFSELAREAGVSLSAVSSDHLSRIEEERLVEKVLAATANFYHKSLTAEARRYLTKDRGFREETILRFKLGWADGKLKQHLIEKCQFPEEVCVKAGVLKKEEGKTARDFFYRRIIFPNIRQGRVVNFTGRSPEGGGPKYLHLPGEIRHLFNEDALRADEILVTESPTDCIFSEQESYGAVALFGTSLNVEHIAKFSRCQVVYLCLDSDAAGIAGARKIGAMLGERARVVELPNGLDLDEFLKEFGKEDFDALKNAAPNIVRFELGLIDPHTPKTELPGKLEPVLKIMARLEEVKAEAYLTHEIKVRFVLTNQEIASYRKLLRKFRSAEGLATPSGTPGENGGTRSTTSYLVESERICVKRMTKDGPVIIPLCNFNARVVEELVLDDGAETTRSFAIEGALESGEQLPLIRVPGSQFNGMAWVTQNWGCPAIVKAGFSVRDQLREAIQRLSLSVQQRRVFTHTGWREVNGKWVYLTANGAVGCEGFEVDLGPGLSRYRLPNKPKDVAGAIRVSLELLKLGPLTVMAPLLASVYRAPLASAFPLDLTIWLEGTTGSLKSTLAALLLSHFGDFDRTNLPGAWAATANHLEIRAFKLKDAAFVIDDFAPSPLDAREQQIKASRLLRAQGNLQGRGRLRADLSERPDYPPRGLIISTGEQHPTGQSILARTPVIEVQRSTIDLAALSEAQKDAGRLGHAMAGYVLWLAPQMPTLRPLLREAFEGTRQRATAENEHLRIPEALAHLWLGLHCFLTYAEEIGNYSHNEAEELGAEAWEALLSLGRTQSQLVAEEKPAEHFLRVLEALLTQHRILLLRRDESAPPPLTDGKLVIWFDQDSLYLNPEAGFQAVARFCREAGESFPVRQGRIMKDLDQEGISECDPGRHSTTAKIGGHSHRVLKLKREMVERLLGSDLSIPDEVTTVTGFQE